MPRLSGCSPAVGRASWRKPSTPAHLKQMGSRAAQQTYCSRSAKRGYCAHEAAWGLTCIRMFILMLQQLWAHPPFPKPSTPAHLKQMGSRAAQQTYCSRSAKRGYCAHEAAWGLTCKLQAGRHSHLLTAFLGEAEERPSDTVEFRRLQGPG